ncbi:MAG: hypothetical protein JWN73_3562 [Betaproteobacteria bacterium]|nr:hypothetical protein [Betaproteobacteria bacterium]
MMTRCCALRKVPIGELKPGDLRVLIGQGIGTEHLMPLALELLSKNALIEGDYYPSAMGAWLDRILRPEGSENNVRAGPP